MCFFGGSKKPEVPQVQPPPAPTPIPQPTQVSEQTDGEGRRQRLQRLRSGIRSTIKTSPRGLVGTGVNLASANATGKATLGV